MSNSILSAPQCEAHGLTLGNFADQYKQEIYAVIKQLRGFCGKTIDIEGGHIYSDDKITEHYAGQLRQTALLQDILANSGYGFDIQTTLFVDNYHPAEHTLNVAAYRKIASDQGLHFDQVMFEAAMVPEAEVHIQTLQEAGMTKIQNGNISLQSGEHLVKTDSSLSCGILDATLSKSKLERSAAGVIVLPNDYKSQQRNMRTILSAIFAATGETQSGPMCAFFTKSLIK